MEFDGFDRDRGNREMCQEHGMPIGTIETIFEGPVLILPDTEKPLGEQRYRAVGTTAEGRKAFVVFTLRERDVAIRPRTISARCMHRKEVDSYEKADPDV